MTTLCERWGADRQSSAELEPTGERFGQLAIRDFLYDDGAIEKIKIAVTAIKDKSFCAPFH